MSTELLGIRELLSELSVKHVTPMELCVDNQVALKQLDGESSSVEAKHIDVRLKFVGSFVKQGVLKPQYCEGARMPADMLTKALKAPRLLALRGMVGLR